MLDRQRGSELIALRLVLEHPEEALELLSGQRTGVPVRSRMEADVARGDVAICAHVLYVIQDIEAFVRKLEVHAGRVLVIMFQAPPQSQIYPMWEPMHGVPRLPLPSLPEFLEVLDQLRIVPDVEVVHTGRSRGFDSLETAKEQIARRLYVTPDSPEMERLEALLPQVLEQKDSGYSIKGAVPLEPRVISWRPAV